MRVGLSDLMHVRDAVAALRGTGVWNHDDGERWVRELLRTDESAFPRQLEALAIGSDQEVTAVRFAIEAA